MDNKALINEYVKAALAAVLAGAKLAETSIDRDAVSNKGNLRDIVTKTDHTISDLLIEHLKKTGLPTISEEREYIDLKFPETMWVIDPIDGSVNFANEVPLYAISIGLVQRGLPEIGFVCIPKLDELYFTLTPESSLINGRPFKHEHRESSDSLVAASFSGKPASAEYELFQQVNETTRGCLRTGSAALNICWAAKGKLQAAYGFGAKLWDVAGALAIAKAACCETIILSEPNSLLVNYCVGSKDVVKHITSIAREKNLLNHE